MIVCRHCGRRNSPGSRFCAGCGKPPTVPPPPPHPMPWRQWYTLDEIMARPDKRLGGIGVLLAFFGAYVPWTTGHLVDVWWLPYGYANPYFWYWNPYSWLVALAAVIGGVFLFRRGAETAVMASGGIGLAFPLIFALSIMQYWGPVAAPSIGLLMVLIGHGLLVYSGYATSHHRQRAYR